MGICWYCHWGWPEQVRAIYDKGCEKAGWLAMHYGPGHIVWEDENFDSAQWCIDNAEKYRHDLSDEQLAVVIESLKELLALPEDVRNCEPADYDDEHPEKFPPPQHLNVAQHRWWG